MRFAKQMFLMTAPLLPLAGFMVCRSSCAQSPPDAMASNPAMIAEPAPAPRLSADAISANAALADRFSQMAQNAVAGNTIVPETLKQSAALLECANTLDPNNSRTLRLLVEAYLQLGGSEGRDGAISALRRYLKLQPNDQSAQIKLIDLHASQIDAADKKLSYYDDLLKTDPIAAEVRSQVAVQAARISIERASSETAQDYIQRALKLFPLNPEALQLQYSMLPSDASALQRVTMLLQMLRSNPAQPEAMVELAEVLGQRGMVDPSLNWYQQSFNLIQRQGRAADPRKYTNFVTELLIADQIATADGLAQKLVETDPMNSEAAFVALLTAQRGKSPERIEPATEAARKSIRVRLGRISDRLNDRPVPEAGAVGAPASEPQFDIADDVKKLNADPDAVLYPAYVSALGDMAWLEIYFAKKPADAEQYLAAMRQMLPGDSPLLVRLEGWSYLVQDKPGEAKVKLSAVADRDPLAALGVLKIDTQNPAAGHLATMKQLLNENASGLVGAVLIEAFRNEMGLMPTAPDASEVLAELNRFPTDLMDFLDFDKVKNFYAIKAQTDKVPFTHAEAIVATITITNVGQYDLTVGPNGAIRPDLWFDVQVRGLVTQYIPGIAFERIGEKLLLKPKESMSVSVRLDQGPLNAMFQSNVMVSLPLYFSVLTNPLTQSTGIAPGPGGFRAQFTRVAERSPSPLSPATLKEHYGKLATGSGAVKFRTLELLGALSAAVRRAALASDAAGAAQYTVVANEIADAVRKSTGDSLESVRADAMGMTAQLSEAPIQLGIIKQMLADESFAKRAMGLSLLQLLEPSVRKELAQPLTMDANKVIASLADATIGVADLPPPATPDDPIPQPGDAAAIPNVLGVP